MPRADAIKRKSLRFMPLPRDGGLVSWGVQRGGHQNRTCTFALTGALRCNRTQVATERCIFGLPKRQDRDDTAVDPEIARQPDLAVTYKANVGGSSPSAPTKILDRIPRTHSKFARKFCGSDPEHVVVPPPRARSWRLRRLRPARAGRAAAMRNRVADDAVLGLKTRLAAWINCPTSAAL